MSRPAHIAALDDGLDKQIALFHEGTRELTDALDTSLAEMDRLERELAALKAGVTAAERKRRDAWYGAQKIEETIRDLDFVVLGSPQEGGGSRGTVGPKETRLEGLEFGAAEAIAAARIRLGLVDPKEGS